MEIIKDIELTEKIGKYWDEHIHDLAIAKHPVGTKGFFQDLSDYRFDKLRYLPKVVDFTKYKYSSYKNFHDIIDICET